MSADKPMQGHGLMQAIARVSRLFLNKPGGPVVDTSASPIRSRRRGAKHPKAVGQGNGSDLVMEPVVFAARIDDPGAVSSDLRFTIVDFGFLNGRGRIRLRLRLGARRTGDGLRRDAAATFQKRSADTEAFGGWNQVNR
jgi:hypothetical protein